MKEELYIKGEAVDLGSANISLNYKSNIFGDISKITASNSVTIALPKTSKNTRLLDLPDVPAHRSYMMRDYFDCAYYRNGILMLNGKAIITNVSSDTFNIALSWGIDQKIIDLINSEKTLSDFIDDSIFGIAFKWDSSATYEKKGWNDTPSHGYLPLWAGIDVDKKRSKVFIHPSVSVSLLFSNVLKYFNSLSGAYNVFPKKLDYLYLPLLSQNEGEKNQFYANFIKGGGFLDEYFKLEVTNAMAEVDFSGGDEVFNTIKINSKEKKYSIVAEINPTYGSNVQNDPAKPSDLRPSFLITSANGVSICDIKMTQEIRGKYSVAFELDPSLYPSAEPPYNCLFVSPYTFIDVSGEVTIKQTAGEFAELKYKNNAYYYLKYNMPDIQVIDFIKNVCWLCGVFPVVSPVNDKLQFVSFSTLIKNKVYAVDWSNKIMTEGNAPAEVSYKFGDFARKNWMRYKENEDAESADGSIIIDDKSLDEEKDLLTTLFKAGGDGGRLDAVPYFELDDDGEIELVDCGDRIMVLDGDTGKLTFNGLDFQTIINKYYQDYIDIIKEPFVIKDKFRLTELDLKNLDYTLPVYIERYGAYFAIISIQVQGEISTCELLKL